MPELLHLKGATLAIPPGGVGALSEGGRYLKSNPAGQRKWLTVHSLPLVILVFQLRNKGTPQARSSRLPLIEVLEAQVAPCPLATALERETAAVAPSFHQLVRRWRARGAACLFCIQSARRCCR